MAPKHATIGKEKVVLWAKNKGCTLLLTILAGEVNHGKK